MKAAALRGALSDRARAGRVHVVDGLHRRTTAPSTKAALARAGRDHRRVAHVLVVLERGDVVAAKSLRNVDRVHVLAADQLNTYDVLVVRRRRVHPRRARPPSSPARPGGSVKAVATSTEAAELERRRRK